MPELAYVNGTFSPVAEATVSIEDRGFQFGDGIYEVIAVYGGRTFLLDQHMRRLRRSAEAIGLDYDFAGKPLEPVIEEGLRRCGLADAIVYVQLTRGAGPRSHIVPPGIKPTVVLTFRGLPTVPDEIRRRGVRLMTTRDVRWANCYIKALTLLPNVLAKNEAVRRGFDDAVFVSDEGVVRECTSSNLFVVCDERVLIPPRTESILHGITQEFILGCAKGIGVNIAECEVTLEMLRRATEVFLSSTTTEVLGVTSVDGAPVADGRVGPITERLFQEFRKRARTPAPAFAAG